MIEFTFDDGPSEWTPQILDLLAKHDVKATFFVIGMQIEGRENILRRAVAEGHALGNHTWSHPRLTELDNGGVNMELVATQMHLYNETGVKAEVWRAPFYGTDDRVNAVADMVALRHVGADIIPEDCFTNDALLIAERVIGAARARADIPIVSLHDGIPPDGGSERCTASRQPTVDAVRLILEALA